MQILSPIQASPVKPGESHSPRLPYRFITAGKGDVFEMEDALIIVIIRDQDLATPYCTIVSITCSIERYADDRLVSC